MSNSDFTAYVPPTGTALTTTGQTTVYTARRSYANAVSVWITNKTAIAAVITIDWYDSDITTQFKLCFQYSVPANGMLVIEPRGFCLDINDEIRATAGTANAFDVVVSAVEIAGRSG